MSFSDWKRPALAAAVDWLIERFSAAGQLDLQKVVLALPGGRAGRRLLEILVAEAERRQLQLCPPRMVTAGKLPELLYQAKRPFAEPLTQQLAWTEAFRRGDPYLHEAIALKLPAENDLAARLSLGETLAGVHCELAGDGLNFADVAERGCRLKGFPASEIARWKALAEIQKHYLAILDGLGLWDMQTARQVAIDRKECRTEARVVLIGAADLNRSQRMILDQVADRVTALVFAPEELADHFDEHGCIRPAAWLTHKVPISDAQIEVAEGPADQAEAVVRAIAGFEGRYNTEQIVVGMADEQIVPEVEQRLRRCGLPVRYGVGTSVSRSAVFRLLAAAADYVESSSFSALAALVRHPSIHEWLLTKAIPGDWLSEMDRYQGEHIPRALGSPWQGEGRSREAVAKVYATIECLCRPLQTDWADPVLSFLAVIFGQESLRSEVEPDRTVRIVYDQIREALVEQHAVPAALTPAVAGLDAVRLVLRQIEGGNVPPLPDAGALELLGWLELPLDDAPAVVVTGFNEGRVPASLNSDVFLPNQLRRELGIVDNDRRYARDAYALSVLAASREELRLIAGRRSAEGEPMLPSRLLFTCDDRAVAGRVTTFFDDKKRPRRPRIDAGRLRPGVEESLFERPKPLPLKEKIQSMRVTEFKDYIACPYRYYLGHALRLEKLADEAVELDGAGFGTLAHEVLSSFEKDPDVAAAREETIAKYLDAQLDATVLSRFGKAPSPAIRVQVEQLRRRLHRFARWQADWAANGWRVEWVEGRRVGCESLPEEREAEIVVDAQPTALHGRIDRIDVQPSTGRRVIIDYKTSDTPTTPEKAHRKKGAGSTLGCRFIATFRRPKSLRPGLGGLTCNCRCTGTWSRAWGSRALLAWPTSCCPRTLVR